MNPQYALTTASYWGFTLTDGALRMLVVLHFHQLGYSPLEIALLFLFYEFFGIVTNLLGGWVAGRIGLGNTLLAGLLLQCTALGLLTVDPAWLSVLYVMFAQALSGIAKDLVKLSAKSSVKLLVDEGANDKLYRWVAALTGSKNALKGIGFFLGGLLLSQFGFSNALLGLALGLGLITGFALFFLNRSLGKTEFKPKFTELFSSSGRINRLSAARFFLFGARDVWFVVALPVYLQIEQGWQAISVAELLALWVMGYGLVQFLTPRITQLRDAAQGSTPQQNALVRWGLLLALSPAVLAVSLSLGPGIDASAAIVLGIAVFGVLFAINSAVHSYLIVHYADTDGVARDVGFYYMSNAAGRLAGTLLSGALYQAYGLAHCLWVSAAFILLATAISYVSKSNAIR